MVGRFVMLFGPPEILDGGWENPSYLDFLSNRISRASYVLGGAVCVGLQCFWLYWVRRRGAALRRDGIISAVLGFGLLWTQVVLEVHPGYLAAYALIISILVGAVFSGVGQNGGA